MKKNVASLAFWLLPLIFISTASACGGRDKKNNDKELESSPAEGAGSFSFTQPDLDQQKIDSLVLELVNKSNASRNKTLRYAYQKNAEIKAENIGSGDYNVKISAYSNNKLILAGGTTVSIVANKVVEAYIDLELVSNANTGSLIVKIGKKAANPAELACEYAARPIATLCEVGTFTCTYEGILPNGAPKKYEGTQNCGANFIKANIYSQLCTDKVAFTEAENAKIQCKKL